MQIQIKTNFPDVIRSLGQLQADLRDRALVSAVNKTIAKARTNMVREISREYNVTAGYVRDRLNIERARFTRGKAVIAGALVGGGGRGAKRSANLIAFVDRTITLAAAAKRMAAGEGGRYGLRNGAMVTKALELQFKIKRSGPKKTIKGAFIANQGRTVFIREGTGRLPIKALSTIDVPQMFNAKRLNARVVAAIFVDFPGIFDHEAKFYTDRFNARRAAA